MDSSFFQFLKNQFWGIKIGILCFLLWSINALLVLYISTTSLCQTKTKQNSAWTIIEHVFRIKNSWYFLCPMGKTSVLQGFLFKCLSSKYWVPNLSVWQYPSEASFPVNPKYDNGWALQGQKAISVSQRTWKDKKTKRQKKETERQKDIETKRQKYRNMDNRQKRKKKERDMTKTQWFTDERYFVYYPCY